MTKALCWHLSAISFFFLNVFADAVQPAQNDAPYRFQANRKDELTIS